MINFRTSDPEEQKKTLLDHYAGRDPHAFWQFDCFCKCDGYDYIIVPDEDCDSLFRGLTYELMTGNVSVRVLIVPGTAAEDAIRALGKIASWIKKLGDEGIGDVNTLQ